VGRDTLSEDKLLNLDQFATHPAYSERERLALRLAHAMAATPADVDDALFAQLQREFTDAQIEELASAIAWENYLSRHNRVFRIDSDGFTEGHVCALPMRRG
jgi:alkylhydroperoxidase family enzyme